MAKRRHFLLAIIKKAKEEFTLKEAIPEAVVGFLYAVYLRRNGLEDEHGQREIIVEAILYAFLLPCIGFLFRAFFTAPGEIVKEILEAKKAVEIDPKSVYPSIVTILLVVCSVLAGILILNFDRAEQPGKTIPIAKKEPQKPLPTKTIPSPEPPPPPPATSTQQVAAVATQPQFEVVSADTGVVGQAEAKFAKFDAEEEAKIEAEKQQKALEHQKYWQKGIDPYKHSLAVLNDVLYAEAAKYGDGIQYPKDYFQCVSSNIDLQAGDVKTTIGFQKNTNVIFLIVISTPDGAGHRQLNISCAAGNLQFFPGWGDDFFGHLQIKSRRPFDKQVPLVKANELVSDYVSALVGAQFLSLSNTNK